MSNNENKKDIDKKPSSWQVIPNDGDKAVENKSQPNNTQPNNKSAKDFFKNLGTSSFAILLAIIVAVAVIPINLLAGRLNVEWDMTPNELYTGELSEVSQNIINNLDDKIEIYFLMDMSNLEGDYEVGLVLKNILEKYDECENIELITGDPDEHPELFAEFSSLALSIGDIVVKSSNGMYKHVLGAELFLTRSEERRVGKEC